MIIIKSIKNTTSNNIEAAAKRFLKTNQHLQSKNG